MPNITKNTLRTIIIKRLSTWLEDPFLTYKLSVYETTHILSTLS